MRSQNDTVSVTAARVIGRFRKLSIWFWSFTVGKILKDCLIDGWDVFPGKISLFWFEYLPFFYLYFTFFFPFKIWIFLSRWFSSRNWQITVHLDTPFKSSVGWKIKVTTVLAMTYTTWCLDSMPDIIELIKHAVCFLRCKSQGTDWFTTFKSQ